MLSELQDPTRLGALADEEVEEVLREFFDENYHNLRVETGHQLAPDVKEAALQQVLLYWQKMRQVASKVTETEVKLTLPGQTSPGGLGFGIEGIVDIVHEDGKVTMYDLKTHDVDFIRSNTGNYEGQLNVYAHIWQELRGRELHATAILSTVLPPALRDAIMLGDETRREREFDKWNPVVEIPFNQDGVGETIQEFGSVVDEIESGNFRAPSSDVLRSRLPGQTGSFAQNQCRNCDARYSCDSFRDFAREANTAAARSMRQMFGALETQTERDARLIAGLEADGLLIDLVDESAPPRPQPTLPVRAPSPAPAPMPVAAPVVAPTTARGAGADEVTPSDQEERIGSLEEMIERWPDVMYQIRVEVGVTAAAYLHDATPIELTADEIVLEFTKPFSMEKATAAAERGPFESKINELLDRPRRLRMVLKNAPVAPTPDPAPTPALTSTPAPSELERFVEAWPLVLTRVREQLGVTAATLLSSATPIQIADSRLVLDFPHRFYARKAIEGAARFPFESALNTVFKQPHKLVFAVAGQELPDDLTAPTAQTAPVAPPVAPPVASAGAAPVASTIPPASERRSFSTVSELAAAWPEVLQEIGAQYGMAAATYLASAKPVEMNERTLILEFPSALYADKAREKSERVPFETMINAVLDEPRKLVMLVAGAQRAAPSSKPSPLPDVVPSIPAPDVTPAPAPVAASPAPQLEQTVNALSSEVSELKALVERLLQNQVASVAPPQLQVAAPAVPVSAPVPAQPVAPRAKKGRRIDSLESLVELWPAVLMRIRKKIGVTAVAYLHDARPVGFSEEEIVLEFTKQFHQEKAQEAARRLPFEEKINETLDRPRRLKLRVKQAPVQPATEPVEAENEADAVFDDAPTETTDDAYTYAPDDEPELTVTQAVEDLEQELSEATPTFSETVPQSEAPVKRHILLDQLEAKAAASLNAPAAAPSVAPVQSVGMPQGKRGAVFVDVGEGEGAQFAALDDAVLAVRAGTTIRVRGRHELSVPLDQDISLGGGYESEIVVLDGANWMESGISVEVANVGFSCATPLLVRDSTLIFGGLTFAGEVRVEGGHLQLNSCEVPDIASFELKNATLFAQDCDLSGALFEFENARASIQRCQLDAENIAQTNSQIEVA